jgi:putative FmdB family regulatory protein
VPTYGYRCPACQQEFDVWQKMSDPPGAQCPVCGADAKRMFFPAGIVFKGTGFYATDSRRPASSGNGTRSSDSSAAAGSGNKTDGGKTGGTSAESPSAPSTSTSTGSSSASPSASPS